MRSNNKIVKSFSIFAMVAFLFLPNFAIAQETETPENSSMSETSQLEQELKAIQQEIAEYEKQLSSVQSEKNTLNKKINELKLQKNKIALQIKETQLNINSLEEQLVVVESDIKTRQEQIQEAQAEIAGLIRLVDKKDRYSFLDILMSGKNLGDYLVQLAEYKKLTSSLAVTVNHLQSEKALLEADEVKLEDQRLDQQNLASIAGLQNEKLSQNLSERRDLLVKTKVEESNYQAILSDKQKRATEIKNRIYDLLGVSREITFGEAVKIAQWAESQTGVRTAFILAVLTQESNLGKNVGTCNRPGDPVEKSWKQIMKPDRDQEPFKTITAELGIDPDITPVSCPMRDKKGNQIGWGGAMGPAQFIPSTWLGYRDKVSAISGKTANPWDIRDAFLAAAILLKANGATSVSGEWAAAMRYFSGSTNTKYRFYGDNVVAIAEKYQQDIEDLNN